MRKLLKGAAIVGMVLAAAAGGLAAYVAIRGIPSYTHPAIQFHVESAPQAVVHGRKLVRLLCMDCHLDPATRALTGKRMRDVPAKFGTIFAPNITQDAAYGIGSWSDGELAFRFRTGIRRDGRCEPPYMIKLPNAADDDIAAIIAFLRSDDVMVKPAAIAGHPSQPSFLVKMLCYFAFKQLYEKYGCNGCHGKAGDGPIDLRRATKKYTTDEKLTAFLKWPSEIDPGNQMPAFEGVVAEDEYASPIAHIRSLQIANERRPLGSP